MTDRRAPVEDLLDGLRAAGLRITEPRRAVCRVLAESPDSHLSPARILERARVQAGRSIDPSTVYRTLDALAGAGLVTHVHLGHGPGVYHLDRGPGHQHLVCEVCGRVEDVPLEDLAPLVRHLEERYRFVADGIHFALSGRCVDHQ